MGLLSWFSSCGTPVDTDADGTPHLIRTQDPSPHLQEIQRTAAEDVALIESDNKRPDDHSRQDLEQPGQ